MQDTKKYLGKRIKEIREKIGLKQTQLAELTGIDPKHVSKIECGRCFPSFDLMDRIARALNVEPVILLDNEHFKNKDEIISEIVDLMKHANINKVRSCYKILKEIL